MGRKYKKKEHKESPTEEIYRQAVNDILKHKKHFGETVLKYGLSLSTLHKRVAFLKLKNGANFTTSEESRENIKFIECHRQI